MSVGAGVYAVTVGSVMERLYQQILTPPDDQGAQASLAEPVAVDDTTIKVGQFTIPEDEELLRQGSILELGQELVRVVSYDDLNASLTVRRGEYGTIPAAYDLTYLMTLNPPYTRASVFDVVADNVILLSPKLFTVGQELLTTVGKGVYPIGDPLAVEILSITDGNFVDTTDHRGKIVDFHPMTGGRALIMDATNHGSVWLRYRRRMDRPTSETDTLDECGVDPSWVNILIVGAAADLIVGRDLPAAKTEWVQSVLEAENIRVGTRMSLGGGLRQYRNMLLEDAAAEMRNEYKMRVHVRRVSP